MKITRVEIDGDSALVGELQPGVMKAVFDDGRVLIGFIPPKDFGVPVEKAGDKHPLYVSRRLKNTDAFIRWAKKQGFAKVVEPKDIHATIAYSSKPVLVSSLTANTSEVVVRGGTRQVAPLGDEGAVVLHFDSVQLSAEWKGFIEAGASWDHDGYHPHVTITYNAGPDVDLTKVKPYTGPLIFGEQIFEELNTDWKDTVVEKENKNHEPAGSPKGGQFASKPSATQVPIKAPGRAPSVGSLVKRWYAGGGEWEHIQRAARVLIGVKEPSPDASELRAAQILLKEVQSAPTINKVLFRGLSYAEGFDNIKVGDTFSESLASWTEHADLANQFASNSYGSHVVQNGNYTGKDVMLMLRTDNAKGISVSSYAPKRSMVAEADEWLTSGRYRVVKIAETREYVDGVYVTGSVGLPVIEVERIGDASSKDIRKEEKIEKSNDCHDPHNGQFCSGGKGFSNFGDELGTEPPPPGTHFKVFRVGMGTPNLDNKNAGNAEAIAEFLSQAADPDSPISTKGDTVSVFDVVVGAPFSRYLGANHGEFRGGNSSEVGRTTRGQQREMTLDSGESFKTGLSVSYSFPKEGNYQAKKIASISLQEIHNQLKKTYGFTDFDESGYGIGAKLLRDLFSKQVEKQDDSIPPRQLVQSAPSACTVPTLSQVLRPSTHSEPAETLKVGQTDMSSVLKFSEAQHPRDDNGRFMNKSFGFGQALRAWHGTQRDVLDKILKEGLQVVPQDKHNFGSYFYDTPGRQGVYLTTDLSTAMAFAGAAAEHAFLMKHNRKPVGVEEWKEEVDNAIVLRLAIPQSYAKRDSHKDMLVKDSLIFSHGIKPQWIVGAMTCDNKVIFERKAEGDVTLYAVIVIQPPVSPGLATVLKYNHNHDERGRFAANPRTGSDAAEAALMSIGFPILSDSYLEGYNDTRFAGGGLLPRVDVGALGWEEYSGLLKKTFYIEDATGVEVGVKRVAWYYSGGVEGGDETPVLVIEDENGKEISQHPIPTRRVKKTNPNHEPAGSSKGGQFASANAGASLPMDKESRLSRARDMGFDTDQVWFHGTFNDFEAFKKARANPQAYWGGGAYFSSSPKDVNHNYVNPNSPDWKDKIQTKAEALQEADARRVEDAGGKYDWSNQAESNRFLKQAKDELMETGGIVMETFLRMKKPLSEFDHNDTFDIGSADKLQNAIRKVAKEWDDPEPYFADNVWGQLSTKFDDWQIPAKAYDVIHSLASLPSTIYLDDNTGEFARNSFRHKVLRELGYDGVVMDASQAFPWLSLPKGTQHAIVFNPADIRSIFAKFDPKDSRSTNVMKALSLAHVLKDNPNHEPAGSSKGGQFAKKPGSGVPHVADVGKIGPFDAAAWKAKGMMDARNEWKLLSRPEKDAYGNPRESIPARMNELLDGIGDPPDTGDTVKDINQRLDSMSDRMAPESRALTSQFMQKLNNDLLDAGVDPKNARALTMEALDHTAAQEIEAYSRTLGDHGVHHLNGDAEIAKEIIAVLPGSVNTPHNRALMSLVAVYHDAGYLTPPSRSWLDADHPRWGAQYFNDKIAPKVEKLFGKDMAQLATQLIASHDHQGINWDTEPELSAFSTADNVALFHREKMPPMLRYVPKNVQVLVGLGTGKTKLDDAKTQMRQNIEDSNLAGKVKSKLLEAVDEVSGVLPKFTLGMVGASLDKVSWQGDHVNIDVKRRPSNEALAKVLDLGQKQFGKLAETYGGTTEQFVKDKSITFRSTTGNPLLSFTIIDEWGKTVEPPIVKWDESSGVAQILKGNPNHHPAGSSKGGQFASNPQTGTAEFKAWFGDSKVVGASGAPLRVYHGSNKDVSSFGGDSSDLSDMGWHYFTDSPKFAEKFSFSDQPFVTGSKDPASSGTMKIPTDAGKTLAVPKWNTEAPGLVVINLKGDYKVTHEPSGRSMTLDFTRLDTALEAATRLSKSKVDFTQDLDGLAKQKDILRKYIPKIRDELLDKESVDLFNSVGGGMGWTGNRTGIGEGSAVYPVYLKMSKPVDLSSLRAKNVSPGMLQKALAPYNINLTNRDLPFSGRDLYQMLNDSSVAKKIKKQATAQGYDGVIFNDYYDDKTRGTSYIVFDSTSIKSAVGNSGAFDPNQREITKAEGFAHILKFYVSDNDRGNKFHGDDGQFISVGGIQMVSPSIVENSTYSDAMAGLRSPRHQAVMREMANIDRISGFPTDNVSTVGAWVDGAENSVLVAVKSHETYEEIRLNAAMKGMLADQKSVIPFKIDPKGKDTMYEFTIESSDLKEINKKLVELGAENHTLQPRGAKTSVWLYDPGSEGAAVIQKVGEHYGAKINKWKGEGEFLGDWDSRTEGRRKYQEAIDLSNIGPDRGRRWEELYSGWRTTNEALKLEGLASVLKYSDTQPRKQRGDPDGGQFTRSQGSAGGTSGAVGDGPNGGRAGTSLESGPANGRTIQGVHYSSARRESLDGRNFGKGMRSSELNRVLGSEDKRTQERIYAYIDEGNGVFPESGVGGVPHAVTFKNVYNMVEDPDGIRKAANKANPFQDMAANAFESALLDKGYNGYFLSGVIGRGGKTQGVMVLLGKATEEFTPDKVGVAKAAGLAHVLKSNEQWFTDGNDKEVDSAYTEGPQTPLAGPTAPSRGLGHDTLKQDTPAAPVSSQKVGFARILKYQPATGKPDTKVVMIGNPYQDALGRFTDKAHSVRQRYHGLRSLVSLHKKKRPDKVGFLDVLTYAYPHLEPVFHRLVKTGE